jgi:hypothetical protein
MSQKIAKFNQHYHYLQELDKKLAGVSKTETHEQMIKRFDIELNTFRVQLQASKSA